MWAVASVFVLRMVFFAARRPEDRSGENQDDHRNYDKRGRDRHALAPSEIGYQTGSNERCKGFETRWLGPNLAG